MTTEQLFKKNFEKNNCYIDYDSNGFEVITSSMEEYAKLKVDENLNEANDLIAELAEKANKYDELVAKISKFYEVDEKGEDVMKGCDLCDIGEVVASELGFI